jgi:tRNA-2-methylthio-N6-dimethylallyladenosine synthase
MRLHSDIPVLVPFVHIPVQSGNDRILKLMNRGHSSQEYLDKLNRFKDVCPNIQFSSDFIVGFPTETEAEFEDTLKLAERIGYTLSYSFKYSRRKNTPATQMADQIPESIKKRRLKVLQDVLLRDQIYYNDSIVGQTMEVLFDRIGRKPNQYIGKNVYMQSVVVESQEDLIGMSRNVLIEKANNNSVCGKLQ